MKKFRIAALLAVLALCLSLTACGLQGDVDLAPEQPEPPTGQETVPDVSGIDFAAAREAYPLDAVVCTVAGHDVTWSEYFYWLSYAAKQLESYFGPITDWNAVGPFGAEITYNQYVRDFAVNTVTEYAAIAGGTKSVGATLTQADYDKLDQLRQSEADLYADGDVDAFYEFLQQSWLEPDYYNYTIEVAQLYQNAFAMLYGPDGADLADEEVDAFIESAGYLRAKHVLISTLDENGAPVSDAEKADKLALAEQIAADARAADSADAAMDELIRQYGEDPGMEYYTDGYVFGPGQMVDAFYDTTAALAEGAVSDPVESSYGYHVILRLPLTGEMIALDGTQSLRSLAASAQFGYVVDGWINAADLQWNGEFEALTPEALFA